jgi:site-specific recombinase XerD
MNTFNVKQNTEQALSLMEENVVKANTIKVYKRSGFGSIMRHFSGKDITDVTAEMLDTFVLEQRACCERKEISTGKWSVVRRSCEFLKQCADKKPLDMSYNRSWDANLRKPRQSLYKDSPTSEQLADPDCLFSLAWRTKQELIGLGMKATTIKHYTAEGLNVILRRHAAHGLEYYSETLIEAMLSDMIERCHNSQAERIAFKRVRKAAVLLREMYHKGAITLVQLPKLEQRKPLPSFSKLLHHFCEHSVRTGALMKSTVMNAKSSVRMLLFALEDSGFRSFDGVTLTIVSETVTQTAKRYTSGLPSAIFIIKKFLRHLHEHGFTAEDFSRAIPELVAHRSTFREGFTPEEIALLLGAPDMETPKGKRDYAMMLLAVQTGLRACDVVNIRRENIDWRAKEIHIVQRKTGQPLSLPLTAEAGNAIAEYILHGRPESNLSYIFLCCIGVKRPISNSSASNIVTRYMKRVGIYSASSRRGFHSFRRSFGTRLLQSEVPVDMIRQLLGHTRIDSLKPYLSVDEQSLKSCAIGLAGVRKAGDRA